MDNPTKTKFESGVLVSLPAPIKFKPGITSLPLKLETWSDGTVVAYIDGLPGIYADGLDHEDSIAELKSELLDFVISIKSPPICGNIGGPLLVEWNRINELMDTSEVCPDAHR